MKNFQIIKLYDLNHPLLTDFRKSIFTDDLNLNVDLIESKNNHQWFMENLDRKISEDAYKFSNSKFFQVSLDEIICIIYDEKIVGISGSKIYNRYLRSQMFFYILKKYRKDLIGIMYKENGLFENHLDFASNKNLNGIFFTIYPYNGKLKGLIENHTNRLISLYPKEKLLYLKDIQTFDGYYIYNNVEQKIFYYDILYKKYLENLENGLFDD